MALCGIVLPQIPTPQKFKDPKTLEHELLTQRRDFSLISPPPPYCIYATVWGQPFSPSLQLYSQS